MKSLLCICTKDRIEDVHQLIKVLKNQIRVPDEILILDSSTKKVSVEYFQDCYLNQEINYLNVMMTLIEARKFAYNYANKNSFDILHFIDDDTIPYINYFDKLEEALKNDNKLLACGGTVIDNISNDITLKIYDLFNMDGKVSLFGNGIATYSNLQTFEVEWLPGCSMSFRVDSLQNEFFDLSLNQCNSMGEDLHISHILSRKGKLARIEGAFIFHYQSPIGRPNNRNWIKFTLIQRRILLEKLNFPFIRARITIYLILRSLYFFIFIFKFKSRTKNEIIENLQYIRHFRENRF